MAKSSTPLTLPLPAPAGTGYLAVIKYLYDFERILTHRTRRRIRMVF
jgi:hypothetical protein